MLKNFFITEHRYFQFRWKMFNMPNHVNFSNPITSIGLTTTGKIFGAGSARQMQFGAEICLLARVGDSISRYGDDLTKSTTKVKAWVEQARCKIPSSCGSRK